MDTNPPCVSFIGIVDFSEEARWIFLTDSVADLLGYEPHELVGKPSLQLVHPDEFPRVKQMHYDTISQDKAAVLAYLRMRHKDPYKGYILCGISRTVVHNVLVGSVSFASPGPKAMHNASTAQEVEIVTPSATNFEFRRWNDPSPMPPSPRLSPVSDAPSPGSPSSDNSGSSSDHRKDKKQAVISFDPLPSQSLRTALILDRFTVNCTIIYCSNDNLVSTTTVMGRSFFDFVAQKDEDIVRSWIDVIKGWGVNERGQPSDGGFGFGKFTLCKEGRDSSSSRAIESPSRRRNGSQSARTQPSRSSARTSAAVPSRPRTRPQVSGSSADTPQTKVDAIFSAHSDGLMVILRRSS
jgi:hypothetical protein